MGKLWTEALRIQGWLCLWPVLGMSMIHHGSQPALMVAVWCVIKAGKCWTDFELRTHQPLLEPEFVCLLRAEGGLGLCMELSWQ